MPKHTVLYILIILLMGANIFLYRMINADTRKTELLQEMLEDSGAIDDFIAERVDRLDREARYKTSGKDRELWQTAKFLADKTDTFRLATKDKSSFQKERFGYFTIVMAVNKEQKDDLWDAHEKFQRQVSDYLETEVPKLMSHLQEIGASAHQTLQAMDAEAVKRNEGRWKQYFKFQLSADHRIQVEARWTKKKDTITWEDGSRQFLENMTRLEKSTTSRAMHTRHLLNKLALVFEKPDRLVIYGTTYELSGISPAELTSCYKYITFLQLEISNSISAIQNEISRYP